MNSRKISLVLSIAVILLMVIGSGLAYTSSTQNTGNTVLSENIVITPVSGDADPYVGSTKVVVYNSVNDRGTVTYGISSDASLTELTAVRFTYNCPESSKDLNNISMTINTDMFNRNGYDSNAITVELEKDSKVWTGVGPYVDQYEHTMKWVFGPLATDESTHLTASNAGDVYNLTFQIAADSPGAHPHSCKLEDGGNGTFDIIFKSNTQAETTYYLYMMNNGHGETAGAATDTVVDSVHKFSQPSDLVATGYVFGGWYSDSACSSAFDFDSAVYGDTIVYAKWTPQSLAVTLTLPEGSNITSSGGDLTQYVDFGTEMTEVVLIPDSGYYFPYDIALPSDTGLTITRLSATKITVTGMITSAISVEIPVASSFDISAVAGDVAAKAFEQIYKKDDVTESDAKEENWWVYTGLDCSDSVKKVYLGGHQYSSLKKVSVTKGNNMYWDNLGTWKVIDGKLYIAVPALYSLTDTETDSALHTVAGKLAVKIEDSEVVYLTVFSAMTPLVYTMESSTVADKVSELAYVSDNKVAVLKCNDADFTVKLTTVSASYNKKVFRYDDSMGVFGMYTSDTDVYSLHGNISWKNTDKDQAMTRYSKIVTSDGIYAEVDFTFIYTNDLTKYVFNDPTSLTVVTVNTDLEQGFSSKKSQGLDLNGWDLYIGPDGSINGIVNTFKMSSKNHVFYTVTYMDGESELNNTMVQRNLGLLAPSEPTKEGFRFVDWYTEPELIYVYDFNSPVSSSFKLYAKWEAES